MLKINKIEAAYKERKVIENISLAFASGEFCALLGPNGAGKSTFLKTLIGFLPLKKGEILLQNKDIKKWSKIEIARKIAVIPQDYQYQFDYTVKELILMGRFPYLKHWQAYSKKDFDVVDEIIAKLDLTELQNAMYSRLSGGERRRVLIARALAQKTDILLMDEAFANLDINHQLEIMQLLWEINQEHNKLIILVSHNINLSSNYCSRIIMMREGKIIADGSPQKVVNSQNLEKLYSAKLKVVSNPVTQKPTIIYPGKSYEN